MWHVRIPLTFLQAQQSNLKSVFAGICLISKFFEETGLFRTFILYFKAKSFHLLFICAWCCILSMDFHVLFQFALELFE